MSVNINGKDVADMTMHSDEIKAVADRCTVLRKGKYIGTVHVSDCSKEQLSEMMVGRKVNFAVDKGEAKPGAADFEVRNLTVASKHSTKKAVNNVSFTVRKGEIVCIAGL